jgi:hypothetical protein
MSTTITSPAPTDLATRIKLGHIEIVQSEKGNVRKAIMVGELLNQLKEERGHGNFDAAYLKEQCQLEERTAQRYMKLAKNKEQIEARLVKSDTMSEMTINGALALLRSPKSGKGKGHKVTASDTYDTIQTMLVEKLETLEFPEAEAASAETIRKLNKIVEIKRSAIPKAA